MMKVLCKKYLSLFIATVFLLTGIFVPVNIPVYASVSGIDLRVSNVTGGSSGTVGTVVN